MNANSRLHWAPEVPASISVNGIAHAVMMLSPCELECFAIGFAFAEGIIDSIEDVRDLVVAEVRQPLSSAKSAPELDTISIELEISPRRWQSYRRQTMQRQGNSSCGLCGHEALHTAMPELTPLSSCPLPSDEQLKSLSGLLAEQQALLLDKGSENSLMETSFSDGLHVALLRNPNGEVLSCQQDIGRHNALDKIIGFALQNNVPLTDHNVVISSRSSVELVQKAVRARLSTLIHLGTPSSLAVQLARYYGLNLLRYTRQQSVQVFSPDDQSLCE